MITMAIVTLLHSHISGYSVMNRGQFKVFKSSILTVKDKYVVTKYAE